MATVFDIAVHIQSRLGNPGRMKMNKLAYYVQAWSLVWREQPAFTERIEAWKDGPVVEALWVAQNYGDPATVGGGPLPSDLSALVDRVLVAYGHMSADDLSDLTHSEDPWKLARGATPPGTPSDAEISRDAMVKFYGHRWIEAERDNAAAVSAPAFRGSIDDFEARLAAE